MKNPQYFRLYRDGEVVGFKRVITEYLPMGQNKWLLEQVQHCEAMKLAVAPLGISTLNRPEVGVT